MDIKNNNMDYKQGYIDGQKSYEKLLCKNIIEMIDNGFIQTIEDVKKACEKGIQASYPYLV